MSPFSAALFAAAALLGAAGVAKVSSPGTTRVAMRSLSLPSSAAAVRALGVAELATATWVLAVGGRAAAAFVGLWYVGFAVVARGLWLASRGRASCGCFGASSAPVGPIHVAVNLAIALAVAGTVLWPSPGVVAAVDETPWAGVPFLALSALLAWLLYVSLTSLAELADAVRTRAVAA